MILDVVLKLLSILSTSLTSALSSCIQSELDIGGVSDICRNE